MPQPRYKCVLFDWDGCLAQSISVWWDAFGQAYSEFGVNHTRAELAENFGDWDGHLQMGVDAADGPRFLDRVWQLVENELPGVALYPHVTEVLDALRAHKIPTAVVTSSTSEVIDKALDRLGIADYFATVVTKDDVTHHKPHPEPIELALTRLGMQKSDAVMVGDSTKDLGAALNAVVDSILVYPPEHELFYELVQLKEFHPTHVCHSMHEVGVVLGVLDAPVANGSDN